MDQESTKGNKGIKSHQGATKDKKDQQGSTMGNKGKKVNKGQKRQQEETSGNSG